MSILDIGNYFRMLKPENNVTQNTGSNATKLLQILCKSVGQNCNTAFLFCLKRSQEQPTKTTLELTNNLRKIRCNVTPNTKPLTPADREAETARQNAEQADRIKQLEENALRSAEDKLRYDQHVRCLQQEIEELTRNPVRKQLHYGAQRAPADFLLDPEFPFGAHEPPAAHPHEDILATEHDINDVSPDTSNQEEDVSDQEEDVTDQEEEETAQPTLAQILHIPAVFVDEQTDSEGDDEVDDEEEEAEEE